jgi:hypothetical protein
MWKLIKFIPPKQVIAFTTEGFTILTENGTPEVLVKDGFPTREAAEEHRVRCLSINPCIGYSFEIKPDKD